MGQLSRETGKKEKKGDGKSRGKKSRNTERGVTDFGSEEFCLFVLDD